jgi:hypothetical protein
MPASSPEPGSSTTREGEQHTMNEVVFNGMTVRKGMSIQQVKDIAGEPDGMSDKKDEETFPFHIWYFTDWDTYVFYFKKDQTSGEYRISDIYVTGGY